MKVKNTSASNKDRVRARESNHKHEICFEVRAQSSKFLPSLREGFSLTFNPLHKR